MSRQLLTIMIAGIDIWAMLYALEHHQKSQETAYQPWDVSVVISNPDQPAKMTLARPEQIWVTAERMGIWPNTERALTLAQVKEHLARQGAMGQRVEVRLLCDPSLSLQQWGRVALALSRHAEEIRIAPMPDQH